MRAHYGNIHWLINKIVFFHHYLKIYIYIIPDQIGSRRFLFKCAQLIPYMHVFKRVGRKSVGGETSRSDQKGVMQWNGHDFVLTT